MTEKEFINKIHRLKEIKPDYDWVVSVRKNIFEKDNTVVISQYDGNEKKQKSFVYLLNNFLNGINYKFAFASVLSLVILFTVFNSIQNSLPGDLFFPLKKIAENGQLAIISNNDRTDYNLEVAKNRLDDLMKVAQKNSTENLAPAINEYQANVSKIAGNLMKEKNKKETKKIVLKMADLKKKESKIKTYGIRIGENKKLEEAYDEKIIETLKPLIKDLKSRKLTDEQKNILEKINNDLKNKNYDQALIDYYTGFSYNK